MNAFQTALSNFVKDKSYMSDATNTRCILAKKTIARLSDQKVLDLLEGANVEASKFNSDLYLNSYIVRFVRYTFTRDESDFFKVSIVAFRTAILCYVNNVDMYFSDIAQTVSNNEAIEGARSHLIYHHNERIADKNYRQTNAAIDTLLRLKIIEAKGKNVYSVHLNAIAEAMCAALDLDEMSQFEEKEIDAFANIDLIEHDNSEHEILDSENVK